MTAELETDLEALFRPDWYVAATPEAATFPEGALAHYSLFGWREGRSPHPLFDTAFYLTKAPECLQDNIEPLSHYLSRGWRQMLSPHPLFDPAWYLCENRDVLEAEQDPWLHYLQQGWRQGRSLHPLFDTKWYLALYEDVAEAGVEPLSHYLRKGWLEGRSPHPLFGGPWYQEAYGLEEGINPWLDYIQTGWRAGRSPHPRFDADWYLTKYLDPLAGFEPLQHYLSSGWREGLLPHPDAQLPARAAQSAVQGEKAPLYLELTRGLANLNSGAQSKAALRDEGRRGRLLLVTHDTQLGGAQTVLRLFADWVTARTRFSVGIVAISGGHFRPEFEAIAPVFVLSDHAEADRAAALADWAGADVQAVFVNSIVSGSFYKYWPVETPSVAFIHDCPRSWSATRMRWRWCGSIPIT
ncbi:hypothetical protein [Pseudophaeobacter leonis]|uniref:hypothetical protein n=1 Tax=Pseudophaeobacter leonis TaxID=1144477 RepID=UPI0009F60F51|nr:hypothetical protein [Pseudophaeobacter leonis]